MNLKIKLINRYWLFKQINSLLDINLNILYQKIRPREIKIITDIGLIREKDNFVYYSSEGIRFFTDYWACIELFNEDFEFEVEEIGDISFTITFDLDFENSLVKKEDVYLKCGKIIYRTCYSESRLF